MKLKNNEVDDGVQEARSLLTKSQFEAIKAFLHMPPDEFEQVVYEYFTDARKIIQNELPPCTVLRVRQCDRKIFLEFFLPGDGNSVVKHCDPISTIQYQNLRGVGIIPKEHVNSALIKVRAFGPYSSIGKVRVFRSKVEFSDSKEPIIIFDEIHYMDDTIEYEIKVESEDNAQAQMTLDDLLGPREILPTLPLKKIQRLYQKAG